MYRDKTQLRKDGHRTLESGMNSGRDPVLLTQTECAFASNVTFRNGFPTNRQKFIQVQLADGTATTVSTTGNLNSTTTIANIPSTSGLATGMIVTGTGIPSNTRIKSITDASHVVISQAATATATGVALTFASLGSLAGFQNGNFQGAAIYDIDDFEQHIMVMVGGTLYQLDVDGGITVNAIFNDGLSASNAPQVWMCQADTYFVIQDGKSIPIIMNGIGNINTRRAVPPEVPVATAMAYGQGRLFAAQGRQVIAGDILGGPTTVISFTENTYLSEAAFFGVPLNSGNVIGLIFIEQGDTQTGQGELLMFARHACYSIQASVPREATQTQPGWQGTPGMQKVALTNIGGTGWRNLVTVNQDVFFRSKDGWRTFRTARNEAYGWGGAPISNEMLRVLYTDSLQLLDYASSCIFKNRVFLTCTPSPYPSNISGGGAVFHSLCVMDLQVISSVVNRSNLAYEFSPYFSQRGSPAYDGIWQPPNGLEILQIVQGEFARQERMFVFCYNPTSKQTEIWELADYLVFDSQTVPVTSQIETKTYDFKLPDTLKELRRCELYFTATEASIDVTVEFRSDGYPNWVLWGQCTLPGHSIPCNLDPSLCQNPGCITEGYWFQRKMPTPPNTCDPNTGKLIRVGFHFQLRITWVGPATLLMVMLHAEELIEDPNGNCCGIGGTITQGVSLPPWQQ